ncbi:MAG TPA: NAD(P)H-hydrate dehydratase [Ohtaekwangia sp.]|nr:NAD(P)H-hydrate dehydratase [Ohtaekwangia sp.]
MIRILDTSQIKALDKFTIEQQEISSIELMERACRAFTLWFTEHFNALHKIGIVCGTGNNGGDGLGIARMLKDWGYPVKVWIVKGSVSESENFKLNLRYLTEAGVTYSEVALETDPEIFNDRDILIDALFGSGLSRPLEGLYADIVRSINQTKVICVSVDIPSGLMADKHSEGSVVEAKYTVSFHLPKLAFFFPQYGKYVGEWTLVDIGLNKTFIKEAQTSNFLINRRSVRKLIKHRSRFDHKGTFGHALMIAGSEGKIGAAVLSGRAVLRTGAGLLTIHAPRCGYTTLQTSIPEAMVSMDAAEKFISSIADTTSYSAIGIGPGLGQQPETAKVLAGVLSAFRRPVVLDADALNILAANRELLHLIPPGSILTPHPKEFERLTGKWRNDFERLEKQKRLAAELQSVIIVKGAFTSIVSPEGKVFFNSTGNPGMATGGTGDVLTGILTGFLAQQYSPLDAAILGVYLHGSAGDLAVVETGQESLIASDLIAYLPAAFRQLKH